MQIALFQKIATQLLATHYGLTLNDTRLAEDAYVATLLEEPPTRPFEYLNEFADDCRLDRVDAPFDTGRALTQADEVAALEALDGTILNSDQPTTCGLCGSRTSFDVFENGKQLHCCLGCGHEFVGEPDDEEDDDIDDDDADREDGDD